MRLRKRPLLGSILSVPIEFEAAITDCRLTASDELPQVGSLSWGSWKRPLLPSFEWMIQAFMSSRNVTPLTANRYGWRVRTFFRFLPEAFDIQGISLAEIDAFVTAKLALGWKLHSIIGHCRTLRDFFHFAGAQGWCESSFYLGIRIPRLVSRPIEPKAPEWSEVRRLLRSFQKTDCFGPTC